MGKRESSSSELRRRVGICVEQAGPDASDLCPTRSELSKVQCDRRSMCGAPAEVASTTNNYQIIRRLAVGGMAEVFLARSATVTGVERYCALKRIRRDRATDPDLVFMFLDEARLASLLNHPNVAQVYDIGKLADAYFFTMEYVHGETVRAVLQRTRSLGREVPLGSVLTVIAGAAAGLHHAHERLDLDGQPLNIVHRDVSPPT